jgi:DNA-binding transcriptional ArsR family regulator
MDDFMDESRHAELFKVLSVGSRIRIIELLKQQGPLGVGEMSEILGITPSAVSQHLKILRLAGLVRSERKGYCLPYHLDEKALDHCCSALVEVCRCGCSGHPHAESGVLERIGTDIEALKGYKLHLKRELKSVNARLKALDEEK